MKYLLLYLILSLAICTPHARAAVPNPVENGWGGGSSGVYCNLSHNGWYIQQGLWYRCGFAYDPGNYAYLPAWGFINACPPGSPYYGYCWRWKLVA